MITVKHKARKRGRQVGSILRRWAVGYFVETIAFELSITEEAVVDALTASGLEQEKIADRMRSRMSRKD